MGVNVLQKAGNGLFDRVANAGLGRQTGKRGVLFARAHQRLQDRVVSHRHGFHFDHRQRRIRLAAVARELRHGVAGVGVLIFSYAHAGKQFALDDDFRPRDRFLFYRHALYQLLRLLA